MVMLIPISTPIMAIKLAVAITQADKVLALYPSV